MGKFAWTILEQELFVKMPCDCFTALFNRISRVAPVQDGAKDQEAHSSPDRKNNVPGPTMLRNSSVDASDTCRYYCPLCMMYYECVFETKCCGHTICDECAMEFNKTVNKLDSVATPGTTEETQANVDKDADEASGGWDAEESIPLTPGKTSSQRLAVECPFCRHDGLEMKLITPGEAGNHLRNYDDSPAVSREDTPMRASAAGRGMAKPSPLKVGDSFEKMKAKLVPFERSQGPPPGARPPLPPPSAKAASGVVPANEPVEANLPHEVNSTPMRQVGGPRLDYSTPQHERPDEVLIPVPREEESIASREGEEEPQPVEPSTPRADQVPASSTPRQDEPPVVPAQPVTPGQDGDIAPSTLMNE